MASLKMPFFYVLCLYILQAKDNYEQANDKDTGTQEVNSDRMVSSKHRILTH